MLPATEHSGCLSSFPPLSLLLSLRMQRRRQFVYTYLLPRVKKKSVKVQRRDAWCQVQYFWPRLLRNGGKHNEKKKNPRNEVGSWGARQSWGLGGKSVVLQLKSVSESRDESRTAALPTPEQPLPTPEQRYREPLPPETHPFSPTEVAIQW